MGLSQEHTLRCQSNHLRYRIVSRSSSECSLGAQITSLKWLPATMSHHVENNPRAQITSLGDYLRLCTCMFARQSTISLEAQLRHQCDYLLHPRECSLRVYITSLKWLPTTTSLQVDTHPGALIMSLGDYLCITRSMFVTTPSFEEHQSGQLQAYPRSTQSSLLT